MGEYEVINTWIASLGLTDELQEAIDHGLSGVRLILKGNQADLKRSVFKFVNDTKQLYPNIKIMIDLPGQKPRIGDFASTLCLKKGDRIFLSLIPTDAKESINPSVYGKIIPTHYLSHYYDYLNIGDYLCINDGKTTFIITDMKENRIEVEIDDECAYVRPNRTISLPDSSISFLSLGDYDEQSIRMMEGIPVDMIAVSMVNCGEDVTRAKHIMEKHNIKAELIAKIETINGIKNVETIAKEADALMIARGDLTTGCEGKNLYNNQKTIIETGRKFNKPVIVATGLLSSLEYETSPSISEYCDISYLKDQGIKRFLLADAEVCLNKTVLANHWIQHILE